ncbi:GNAT family N-acetyltransferase [Streptomyces sp. DSM 44915]|uniref:GNAT family N-acetyltransferase n=1 Tax=Streptomyces chisholmiae TaxID=3075540 RepID=A0ABU2JMT7_9ACTN|nr:GNAT family N-acetyltransferase [Streptomyces sp. DSM 44915]MDT0266305.1 GNAT family N-acetyltransferase [Streptomyces sp. DSM 44915]
MAALAIVPFDDRWTAPAAALLASAHRSTAAPWPDVDLADPEAAQALLADWRAVGPGLAAVDGHGTLRGFALASVPGPPGQSTARVRLAHHAAAPDVTREVYRRLYRELAGRLTRLGRFAHGVVIASEHRTAVAALVELGFGLDQVKGLRGLTAPEPARPSVTLRPADHADLPQLGALVRELQRFHAEPPMLRPALVDQPAVDADLRRAVTDARRLVLLAEEGGRPVGMMLAGPDSRHPATATIGMAVVTASARSAGVGTALLGGVLAWADARGATACGVEWTSANLVGDAFWRGHGFVPVRLTLSRLVDARVARAGATPDARDPRDPPPGPPS